MSTVNLFNSSNPNGTVIFAAVQAAICLFNIDPSAITLRNEDILAYAKNVPGGNVAINYPDRFQTIMSVEDIHNICFSFLS
jgi:hypothetical protein